jgi:uncharacterized tellurite resistance protein B-like protein
LAPPPCNLRHRRVAEAAVFDAIKSFVADIASGDKQAQGFDDHDHRVALAALLLHAATVDGNFDQADRDKLHALLKQRFERAAAADREAIDLYHFTHVLNDSLDEAGRCRMIEMMWQIAYADGTASEFEDNLIWRVADLLGVSSTERIALRQRVASARS